MCRCVCVPMRYVVYICRPYRPTLCLKNVPLLTCCDLDIHDPITIVLAEVLPRQ